MSRALFGLLKGVLLGAAASAALVRLSSHGAVLTYLSCTIVGMLVGLVCGRLPWRAETLWTPILKGLVGMAVGAGLCALGRYLLGGLSIELAQPGPLHILSPKDTKLVLYASQLMPLAIGALYGTFVELDDGTSAEKPARR